MQVMSHYAMITMMVVLVSILWRNRASYRTESGDGLSDARSGFCKCAAGLAEKAGAP